MFLFPRFTNHNQDVKSKFYEIILSPWSHTTLRTYSLEENHLIVGNVKAQLLFPLDFTSHIY